MRLPTTCTPLSLHCAIGIAILSSVYARSPLATWGHKGWSAVGWVGLSGHGETRLWLCQEISRSRGFSQGGFESRFSRSPPLKAHLEHPSF